MEKFKLWRLALSLFVCIGCLTSYGQSSGELSMSLDECLQYAKDNSITLQRAKLQIDNSRSDQVIAKAAFLPTISGSVSQSLNSNPFVEEGTSTSYNGSYGVDLSLSLYSGGKNRAQLKQSGINYNVSNLELEEFENSIEVSVTEIYVEILYSIEQIKAAELSLEVSQKSEDRGKEFLAEGAISASEFAQLESATASSKYDLVVAQTQLNNLYIVLKHLLEFSSEVTLAVKDPAISDESLLGFTPTVNEVYSVALESRPEIQSTALAIESAELDEIVARAGYLPTVSLSAGTGISHSTSSSYTFSNQLRDNFSTSLGVNVSIPIFSGFKNKSYVAKAKNNTEIAKIDLTQAQKDLYQTIETLHNNAQTSLAIFVVSQAKLEATDKSLKLVTEQYNIGLKTALELLTEQDNYNQSRQEYLTSKYQLLLSKALLNYYKTDIIKL
ncbi:MAG: TolC family protein [Rikenellaceae bacterium]